MPSVIKCAKYNMFIISIGSIMYYIYANFNIYIYVVLNFMRYLFQIFYIRYFNKTYKNSIILNKNYNNIVFTLSDIHNIFKGSLIELYILIAPTINYSSIYYDFILFIPNSFIFEIILDLFHYITHRISHHLLLYKYVHKKHHEDHININILTTFKSTYLEVIFTTFIPLVITSYIYPLSMIQYHIFNVTRLLVELQGHSALIFRTKSFLQCSWLPMLFGIESCSGDHFNHHAKINCNYSKRFKLWDIVFGTYK
jgi:Delta7-sterol 5-desaturase